MIKAQKNAARLLEQTETAIDTIQLYDTAGSDIAQWYVYAPTQGQIAYVAYRENRRGGCWGITISPQRCTKWGRWYAKSLSGQYASKKLAQDALDNLADERGWRIITV